MLNRNYAALLLFLVSIASCCLVSQSQAPSRPVPRSIDSIEKELVSVDALLARAKREGRLVDLDAAEFVRVALLLDLAEADTARREKLLEEADRINSGKMMVVGGHWYHMLCALHIDARIAELHGKLKAARSIYEDAMELLVETDQELASQGKAANRQLRSAGHRRLMRVCLDLIRARLAALPK